MRCKGFHGRSPLAGLGDVAVGARDAQSTSASRVCRVADDDHPHALAVAATGREPRVVENSLEYVIGQWVVGEPADRTRRTHGVV